MKCKLIFLLTLVALVAMGTPCPQVSNEVVDMQGLWKWSNMFDVETSDPILKTHTLVFKNSSFEESIEENQESKLSDQGTYIVNQKGSDVSLYLSGLTLRVYRGKWTVGKFMVEQIDNIKLDVPALFKRQ